VPEFPAYAILGSGRWASRIQTILSSIDRHVVRIADPRRQPTESTTAFRSRFCVKLKSSGAQIVWLCVPPGSHVPLLMEAAMDAGLHVVSEKPWRCSRDVTDALLLQAKDTRSLLAVHYEYCLLSTVETWRRTVFPGKELGFGGHYFSGRSDHLRIPALENLGSHLLSIKAYAAPQAALSEIRCGYNTPNERCVWLEKAGNRTAFINLLENKEPIIQRFIEKTEGALNGADFPFGLDFALRIAEELAALRQKHGSA